MERTKQMEANVIALAQKVAVAGKAGMSGEAKYLEAVQKLDNARAAENQPRPYPLRKKYR